MSDALLTEIIKKLTDIHAVLKLAPAATAPAAAAAAKTPPAADKAKVAAEKPAAPKAAEKPAEKPAAPKPADKPPGTKAPGGKHTVDQVREIIRKVAADDNLGMQSAKDILMDDGGGVLKVIELKPEFYDRVFEACEVLLHGEGGSNATAAQPDPLDDL